MNWKKFLLNSTLTFFLVIDLVVEVGESQLDGLLLGKSKLFHREFILVLRELLMLGAPHGYAWRHC
jgi:hypothetical protein